MDKKQAALAGVLGAVLGMGLAIKPFFRGVFNNTSLSIPFMPTTRKKIYTIQTIIQNHSKGGSFIDIGSGDGRVVVGVSKLSRIQKAVGIERNSTLYFLSLCKNVFNRKVTFIKADFWNHSLKPYDVVMVFGIPALMPRIRDKAIQEMSHNSILISNKFPVPDLLLLHKKDECHVYRIIKH